MFETQRQIISHLCFLLWTSHLFPPVVGVLWSTLRVKSVSALNPAYFHFGVWHQSTALNHLIISGKRRLHALGKKLYFCSSYRMSIILPIRPFLFPNVLAVQSTPPSYCYSRIKPFVRQATSGPVIALGSSLIKATLSAENNNGNGGLSEACTLGSRAALPFQDQGILRLQLQT
jgi:hypothetical protein